MSTTTLDKTETAPAPAPAPRRRARRRGERGPAGAALLHGGLVVASLIAVAPVAWLFYLSPRPGQGGLPAPGRHRGQDDPLQLQLRAGEHRVLRLVQVDDDRGARHHPHRRPGRRHHRLRGLPHALPRLQAADVGPAADAGLPDRHPDRADVRDLSELGLIDTYGALIAVNCTTAVPYSAWLLKGYFDTIPFEIDEAGRVDGLTPSAPSSGSSSRWPARGLAVAAFYNFITAVGEVAFATTFLLDDSSTPSPSACRPSSASTTPSGTTWPPPRC